MTELNETIDKLSEDIGTLNANHAERMNQRLTIIGVLIGAVIIMAGIIVNLLMKVSKLKKGFVPAEDDDEDEDDFEESGKGLAGFFRKKEAEDVDDSFEEDEDDTQEEIEAKSARTWFKRVEPEVIQEEKKIEEKDDELEILDLDMDDL